MCVFERMSWDAQKTTALINVYREHELLYSPRHEFYRSKLKREQALGEMSAALNTQWRGGAVCTIDDIKRKLNGLRSQYLFEKHKIEVGKQNGEPYTPTIYWFAMMTFLDPALAAINELRANTTPASKGARSSISFVDYIVSHQQVKQEVIGISDESDNDEETPRGVKRKLDTDPLYIPEPKPEVKPQIAKEPALKIEKIESVNQMLGLSSLVKRETQISQEELKEQLETFGKFVANELRGIFDASNDVFLRHTKRQVQQVLIDAWMRIEQEETLKTHNVTSSSST